MFPNLFLKRFLVSATILILFLLLNATFWIGGQTHFGRISVPRLRRDETRKIFFEVETFLLTTKSLNHFDILKERQERESDSVKSFDTRCQCLTNVFFSFVADVADVADVTDVAANPPKKLPSLSLQNFLRRHDIQDNDILHNHSQPDDILHNHTQHNDIQHNDIHHNDIHHNDIHYNDIQHNNK